MKKLFFLFLLLAHVATAQEQDIIPKPASVEVKPGSFTITRNTTIAVKDKADRKTAEFLNEYLQEVYGFQLDVDKREKKDYIRLSTRKPSAEAKDAYSLNVTQDGAAAQQNHYVIMTPGSHMCFDHSQSQREDSVTFGDFTTAQKAYSYEPIPKELTAEQAKYVLVHKPTCGQSI